MKRIHANKPLSLAFNSPYSNMDSLTFALKEPDRMLMEPQDVNVNSLKSVYKMIVVSKQ
jgi:hypothetical protein